MAFAWADTFVAANAVGGMSNGNQTAIDEWPWASDTCYVQNGSGGSGTVTFTFDMSAGPGDKKGFWVWFKSQVDNANGYSITEIRLTDGTTTLWTDSAPGITVTETTFAASLIRVLRIPDSAFSSDPSIAGLVLEFDVTNLHTGNNRFRFSGMRMMKSPFTAAQESSPPASLAGADWRDIDAEVGLPLLGVADAETIVVVPDVSGNGRHLVRIAGSGAIWNAAGAYISHPSGGATRFIGHWGSRVTGNHAKFAHIYPEDTGTTQGVWSTAGEFADTVGTPTDPNDKNICGIDDQGAGDKHLLMSGVGDGASHKYGSANVVFDAWEWITQWVQDSGNEHQWIDDNTTPDIDAASGSNNMFVVSFGDRETDDRPFQGRWKRFIEADVPAATYTETDITDAANVLVNGAAAEPELNAEQASESDAATDATLVTEKAIDAEAAVEVDATLEPTLTTEPVFAAEAAPETDTATDAAFSTDRVFTTEAAAESDTATEATLEATAPEPELTVELASESDAATDANLVTDQVFTAELATQSDTAQEATLSTDLILIVEVAGESDTAIDAVLEATSPEPQFTAEAAGEADTAQEPTLTTEPVFAAEAAPETDTATELALSTDRVFTTEAAAESDTATEATLEATAPEPELTVELASESDAATDANLVTDQVFTAELATQIDEAFDAVFAADPLLAAELAAEADAAVDAVLSTVAADFAPFIVDGAFFRVGVEGGFSGTVVDGLFSTSVVGVE